MKKQKKQTTQQKISRLKKKCDKLYQEIGRKENKYCLVCCGKYSCLHHYFPKSISSNLRYDLENGIPICVKCHYKIHKVNDPRINRNILKFKGDEWHKRLTKKARIKVKSSLTYYKKVEENLKSKLKK